MPSGPGASWIGRFREGTLVAGLRCLERESHPLDALEPLLGGDACGSHPARRGSARLRGRTGARALHPEYVRRGCRDRLRPATSLNGVTLRGRLEPPAGGSRGALRTDRGSRWSPSRAAGHDSRRCRPQGSVARIDRLGQRGKAASGSAVIAGTPRKKGNTRGDLITYEPHPVTRSGMHGFTGLRT